MSAPDSELGVWRPDAFSSSWRLALYVVLSSIGGGCPGIIFAILYRGVSAPISLGALALSIALMAVAISHLAALIIFSVSISQNELLFSGLFGVQRVALSELTAAYRVRGLNFTNMVFATASRPAILSDAIWPRSAFSGLQGEIVSWAARRSIDLVDGWEERQSIKRWQRLARACAARYYSVSILHVLITSVIAFCLLRLTLGVNSTLVTFR